MENILTKLIIRNPLDINDIYIRADIVDYNGTIDMNIKELNLYKKLSGDKNLIELILKSITTWQSYMCLRCVGRINDDIAREMILDFTLRHFIDLEADSNFKIKIQIGSDI